MRNLVRFVVLGTLIFVVSALLGREPHHIALASRDLPDGARERAIEDELLYREGVRRGFDRDDGIVRQRVIQKTLFLAEELAGATRPPSDDELRASYASDPARWMRPPRWTLHQVYARFPAALPVDEAAARIAAHRSFAGLGDSGPLDSDVALTGPQLANALGPAFVAALPTAPTAGVIGPIRSAAGWHLVAVERYEPPAPAPFAEVKPRVAAELTLERRRAAVAAFLTDAFARYTVDIDGQRVDTLEPSTRVAIRRAASAED